MNNFLQTHPVGRFMFLSPEDKGGDTSGSAGEGGGAADQNSQNQTSGSGAGEGGDGGSQGAQSSAGQSQIAAPASPQGSGSAASGSGDQGSRDWQSEYNKLAGTIRTNEDKVKAARAGEAAANQQATTAVKARDEAVARAEKAEAGAMRNTMILEAGIPGSLAGLVTGTVKETIESQIKMIQDSLIGDTSTGAPASSTQAAGGGDGSGSGTGNGSSGSGDGQAQQTQGAGTENGQAQTADQGAGTQDQTSGDQSGSGGKAPAEDPPKPGHTAPKPAEQGTGDFNERFSKADGPTRSRMMQDVIEGKTNPDFSDQ